MNYIVQVQDPKDGKWKFDFDTHIVDKKSIANKELSRMCRNEPKVKFRIVMLRVYPITRLHSRRAVKK